MARTVIGRIGSWPRRWQVLLSLIISVGVGVVFMRTVWAVHDLNFELDGNIVNDGAVSNGLFDWADFFDASGNPVAVLPAGFTASVFERDFQTNANGSFNTDDNTTFATGSKDTLPISTGWQCNHDANVNSKIDIINAYAAAYKAANGDQVIYFGLERNSNTGDANMGFWFLQDAVGCETATTTKSFTGNHRDGDLLIVVAFTNDGVVSTIDVYRWNILNPVIDPIGFLGTTPVAHGVDCRDPATGANDSACATANTDTISVPWLTAADTTGVDHSLPVAHFFEGGLNLTKTGLDGHCFNVFIGETRSSHSLNATLFDFARGIIGECTSSTVTTPSIGLPTPIPANATMTVTDSATVTVAGVASFNGSVEFHLCGPFAANATTLCDTGGVAAGSKPLTTSGQTVVSNTMTITEAGRYCWRADFSASDPLGMPPSSDSRESECFLITPLTASLVTTAGPGPVNFGQPVTDTAILTNTANHQGSGGPAGSTDGSINPTVPGGPAGGTITFTLLKADCQTLATGTGLNPQTVGPVIGDGSYGPVSFTPDAPGTYHWKATYTADLPNTVGTFHNFDCSDPSESAVVRQIPTEIKTKQNWIPNDTATITSTIGNLAAGGSVAFSLYANPTCTGGAVFSQIVPVPGGSPSAEVSTTNTTFTITTGYVDPANSLTGKFSWKVVYTPAAADTDHTGKQSACDAENFNIAYTNDPGPGTGLPFNASESVVVQQIPTEIKTRQSWIPNDTATVTSTIGNLAAGGSVAFSLYANPTCTGGAVFSQNVTVPGGSPSAEVSTTNTTFTITTGYVDPANSLTGKYSWKIIYTPAAADTAHTGKQSACDAENFNITYTNDPGPGTGLPQGSHP